jgi:protoheme IX farnesyltransferase
MVSVLGPKTCTSSALNHTIALTIMSSGLAPLLQLTTWNFAIDSLLLNLYFVYLAYRFKRDQDSNSSRKLFRYSLIYLPLLMLLMIVTKHPIPNDPIAQQKDEMEKLKAAIFKASLQ